MACGGPKARVTEEILAGVTSSDQIRQRSIGPLLTGIFTRDQLQKPFAICDPRVYPSLDGHADSKCATDGGTKRQCLGHQTYIELTEPTPLPQFDVIRQLIPVHCQNCGADLLKTGSVGIMPDLLLGLEVDKNVPGAPKWCDEIMRETEMVDQEYARYHTLYGWTECPDVTPGSRDAWIWRFVSELRKELEQVKSRTDLLAFRDHIYISISDRIQDMIIGKGITPELTAEIKAVFHPLDVCVTMEKLKTVALTQEPGAPVNAHSLLGKKRKKIMAMLSVPDQEQQQGVTIPSLPLPQASATSVATLAFETKSKDKPKQQTKTKTKTKTKAKGRLSPDEVRDRKLEAAKKSAIQTIERKEAQTIAYLVILHEIERKFIHAERNHHLSINTVNHRLAYVRLMWLTARSRVVGLAHKSWFGDVKEADLATQTNLAFLNREYERAFDWMQKLERVKKHLMMLIAQMKERYERQLYNDHLSGPEMSPAALAALATMPKKIQSLFAAEWDASQEGAKAVRLERKGFKRARLGDTKASSSSSSSSAASGLGGVTKGLLVGDDFRFLRYEKEDLEYWAVTPHKSKRIDVAELESPLLSMLEEEDSKRRREADAKEGGDDMDDDADNDDKKKRPRERCETGGSSPSSSSSSSSSSQQNEPSIWTNFLVEALKRRTKITKKVFSQVQKTLHCAAAFGGCMEIQFAKSSIDGRRLHCSYASPQRNLDHVPVYSAFARTPIPHLDPGTILSILAAIPEQTARDEYALDPARVKPVDFLKEVIQIPPLSVMLPRIAKTESGITAHQQFDVILDQYNIVARTQPKIYKFRDAWEARKERVMVFGELIRGATPQPLSKEYRKNYIIQMNRLAACMQPGRSYCPPLDVDALEECRKTNDYLDKVQCSCWKERLTRKTGHVRKCVGSNSDFTDRAVGVHAPARMDEMFVGGEVLRGTFQLIHVTELNVQQVREAADWIQVQRERLRTRQKLMRSKDFQGTAAQLMFVGQDTDLQAGDVYPSVRVLYKHPRHGHGRRWDLRALRGLTPRYSSLIEVGDTIEFNMFHPGITSRNPMLWRHGMSTMVPRRFHSPIFRILALFCSMKTAQELMILPSEFMDDSRQEQLPEMFRHLDISKLDAARVKGFKAENMARMAGDVDGDCYVTSYVQLLRALAELALLLASNDLLSEQFNGNVEACNQDTTLFMYLCSRFKIPLSPEAALLLASQLEQVKTKLTGPIARTALLMNPDLAQVQALVPALQGPRVMTTDRLLRLLLPSDFCYSRGSAEHSLDPSDHVIIHHGRLVSGAITKSDVGKGEHTIITQILAQTQTCDKERTAQFLNSVRGVAQMFFMLFPACLSLLDLLPSKELTANVKTVLNSVLASGRTELQTIHQTFQTDEQQDWQRATRMCTLGVEQYNKRQAARQRALTQQTNQTLLSYSAHLDKKVVALCQRFAATKPSAYAQSLNWPLGGQLLTSMITSRSKGSPSDLAALIGCLGFLGKGFEPLPRTLHGNRCSPHASLYSHNLEDLGFVTGGFLRGLGADEAFLALSSGAIDHGNSSNSVPDTGSTQRTQTALLANYSRGYNGSIVCAVEGKILIWADEQNASLAEHPVAPSALEHPMPLRPFSITDDIYGLRHGALVGDKHVEPLVRYAPEWEQRWQKDKDFFRLQCQAAELDRLRLQEAVELLASEHQRLQRISLHIRDLKFRAAFCVRTALERFGTSPGEHKQKGKQQQGIRALYTMTDLLPWTAYTMVQKLRESLTWVLMDYRGIDRKSGEEWETIVRQNNSMLFAYVVSELCLYNVIVRYRLSKAQLFQVCRSLVEQFVQSRSPPGQMCGILSGSAMGEKNSQGFLNSKHGLKAINVNLTGTKGWRSVLALSVDPKNIILSFRLRAAAECKNGVWIGDCRDSQELKRRLVQVQVHDVVIDHGAHAHVGHFLHGTRQSGKELEIVEEVSDFDAVQYEVSMMSQVMGGPGLRRFVSNMFDRVSLRYSVEVAYIRLHARACRERKLDPIDLCRVIRKRCHPQRLAVTVWLEAAPGEGSEQSKHKETENENGNVLILIHRVGVIVAKKMERTQTQPEWARPPAEVLDEKLQEDEDSDAVPSDGDHHYTSQEDEDADEDAKTETAGTPEGKEQTTKEDDDENNDDLTQLGQQISKALGQTLPAQGETHKVDDNDDDNDSDNQDREERESDKSGDDEDDDDKEEEKGDDADDDQKEDEDKDSGEEEEEPRENEGEADEGLDDDMRGDVSDNDPDDIGDGDGGGRGGRGRSSKIPRQLRAVHKRLPKAPSRQAPQKKRKRDHKQPMEDAQSLENPSSQVAAPTSKTPPATRTKEKAGKGFLQKVLTTSKRRDNYIQQLRTERRRTDKAPVHPVVNSVVWMQGLAELLVNDMLPQTGILDVHLDEESQVLRLELDHKHCKIQKILALIAQEEVEWRTAYCSIPLIMFHIFGIGAAVMSIVFELSKAMAAFGYISGSHARYVAHWMAFTGELLKMARCGMEQSGDTSFMEISHYQINGTVLVKGCLAGGRVRPRNEVNASLISGTTSRIGTNLVQIEVT